MPPSEAKEQEVRERRKKLVALRLAGVDWQTIADQLGYASRGAACEDWRRANKRSQAELDASVEEFRALEYDRLERLRAVAWGRAMQGDMRAAETCLRIHDRLADLLQLRRPQQIEVITIDQLDQQLAELRRQFPDLAVPGRGAPRRAGALREAAGAASPDGGGAGG